MLLLVAKEGDTLPLGAPIAVLGQEGEDPQAALSRRGETGEGRAQAEAPKIEAQMQAESDAASQRAATQVAAPAPAPEPKPAPTPEPKPVERVEVDTAERRIAASPLARRLAREHEIDLSSIQGSGPHGRVIKADVDKAAQEAATRPAAAAPARVGEPTSETDAWGRPYLSRPDETVALSQMRKTIARRMTQSKQEVPHYYLTVEADMEKATSLRAELNLAIEGNKISFNDMIIKAVARALRDYPAMNAGYVDGKLVKHGDVHVGVAVALDEGLVVPVIRHADQKSLEAIAKEMRSLGKRAKQKTLKPNEMTGSTFSISNLGMYGIEEFTAVINPGESGILAIGSIEPRAVVIDGQVAIRKRMRMTLSGDHRANDGAVGAQWLTRVKAYLESPLRLFTDPA